MTYQRVIPRDLFNEANLLKCYGQLWLKLEMYGNQGASLEHYGNFFITEQDSDDGSLSIYNIRLIIGSETFRLRRPLNSREPWPLYCYLQEAAEELAIFTDDGELTEEFLALLPNIRNA
jgi:hypothetical protein